MEYILFFIVILIFIYDILKNNKNNIEKFNNNDKNINNSDIIEDVVNNNINNINNSNVIKKCKLNTSNLDNIHPHFFSWSNLNLKY